MFIMSYLNVNKGLLRSFLKSRTQNIINKILSFANYSPVFGQIKFLWPNFHIRSLISMLITSCVGPFGDSVLGCIQVQPYFYIFLYFNWDILSLLHFMFYNISWLLNKLQKCYLHHIGVTDNSKVIVESSKIALYLDL